MAKDPAFLFYSKDFYEGTRTMLPKERACFVDLMIYQHQNGAIPDDMERISMYCSGIDEATLKATLKAKFKLTDEGWVNSKMCKVISERSTYTSKQSDNGIIGQFFKKAKATIKSSDYNKLRDYIYNDYGKEKLTTELKKEETTHEGLLKALLKHLASVDEDVNEDIDLTSNVIKETKERVFFQDEKLNDAFSKWLKMCKEVGKDYPESAIEAMQMKLNTAKQPLEMVKQSLEKGWKTLHPVDSKPKSNVAKFASPVI